MRNVKFYLIGALMLMSLSAEAQTGGRVAPEHPYNIDRNSVIDINDAVALVDTILKNVVSVKGDLNGDKKIDIADVTFLIDYLKYNGHEYVDLGLTSGTLWATLNIDATSTTDPGSYFAWGETVTKDSYTWSNYSLCDDGSEYKLNKYNRLSNFGTVDNLDTLQAVDDAATVLWGTKWKMPTQAQARELKKECTWVLDSTKGIYTVTGPNGKQIIIPLGGYISGSTKSNVGYTGYYWTTNVNTTSPYTAYCMLWDQSAFEVYSLRNCGRNIRPVVKK